MKAKWEMYIGSRITQRTRREGLVALYLNGSLTPLSVCRNCSVNRPCRLRGDLVCEIFQDRRFFCCIQAWDRDFWFCQYWQRKLEGWLCYFGCMASADCVSFAGILWVVMRSVRWVGYFILACNFAGLCWGRFPCLASWF